jgi:hypothetical protein
MASVKIQTNTRHWPSGVREHLKERLADRRFKVEWASILQAWFSTNPEAPDLQEAPQGWHKCFPQVPDLLICGEGQFWKTLYTPFERGNPRPRSIDLDEWQKRKRGSLGGLVVAQPENY